MMREASDADRPENRVHPKERLLPPRFIEQLLNSGLFIAKYPNFVSSHAAYPSGYIVILPADSGGNSVPEHDSFYVDDAGNEAATFMPSLKIWGDEVQWFTDVQEYAPGKGPGDFRHSFSSLDDVYAEIMSYFFEATNKHFLEMLQHNDR